MRFARHVVLVAVLATGCGTATPSVVPSGSAATQSPDPGTSVAEPAPQTALDLITTAVAEGRLDFPTSLLYRAQALFGDPDLPAEYAAAPGPDEDLGVFLLPDAMGDELPSEIRVKLEPYLVTPIDPRSAFFAGDTAAPTAATVTLAGFRTAVDPVCGDNGWTSQSSNVLRVKVWAKCTGSYGQDIASALQQAEANWPQMTDLMGQPIFDAGNPDTERGLVLGGDSSIDIYLTDETVCPDLTNCRTIANPNTLGWANFYDAGPPPGEPAAGFVVVRRALLHSDPDEFRRTLIHEFFHVLEFAHNTAALSQKTGATDKDGNAVWDVSWFSEASAKWSEWYFEGKAGRQASADLVHRRFTQGFQVRDLALDALQPDPHRYNAYVWPLFMSQEVNPQVIDAAWEAIRPKTDWRGALDAINGRLSFREHFRDFALQNLNFNVSAVGEDPRPKAWQDAFPTFPEGRPTGPQWKEPSAVVTGGPVLTIQEQLAHLSAHYYPVSFDQNAQRITIDATALDPSDAVDLDALVQVGEPAENDWRYKQLDSETEWCTDRPDEDVRTMYLIVSNHDMFANASGAIEIEATLEPCVDVDATLTHTNTVQINCMDCADPRRSNSLVKTTMTMTLEPNPDDPTTFTATDGSWHMEYSFDDWEDRTYNGGADGCIWTSDASASLSGGWDEQNFVQFAYVPDSLWGTLSFAITPQGKYDVNSDCPGVLSSTTVSTEASETLVVLGLYNVQGQQEGERIVFNFAEERVNSASSAHVIKTTLTGTVVTSPEAPPQ